MTSRSHRIRIGRRLAVAAAALAVVAVWAACGRTAPVAPAPAGGVTAAGSRPPAATPPAQGAASQAPMALGASPTATPLGVSPAATALGASSAGDRLLAACTVARLVRLIDRHRFADARRLLAPPFCWSRRELDCIRHIDLISARVGPQPGPDTVALVATVRLITRRGAPLPGGRTTLFFTLGRVRSAGDWLITAIATSP